MVQSASDIGNIRRNYVLLASICIHHMLFLWGRCYISSVFSVVMFFCCLPKYLTTVTMVLPTLTQLESCFSGLKFTMSRFMDYCLFHLFLEIVLTVIRFTINLISVFKASLYHYNVLFCSIQRVVIIIRITICFSTIYLLYINW